MLFSELCNLIDSNKLITIISKNLNSNSEVSRLYFKLYHNPKYYDKISITKMIIKNLKLRIAVHGKVNEKSEMKQIHFVNISNLKKWMLESDEKIKSKYTNYESLKKYKIHSKIMYQPRIIILLDDVEIPDNLNPEKSVVGGVVDTVEHHEWELYLQNCIKKFNEMKSSYFTKYITKKELTKFKPLTEEEREIIIKRNKDININTTSTRNKDKMQKDIIDESNEFDVYSEFIDYNTTLFRKVKEFEAKKNKNGEIEILELQNEIMKLKKTEPDVEKPNYKISTNIIDDIYKIKYPNLINMMISMDETNLLYFGEIKNEIKNEDNKNINENDKDDEDNKNINKDKDVDENDKDDNEYGNEDDNEYDEDIKNINDLDNDDSIENIEDIEDFKIFNTTSTFDINIHISDSSNILLFNVALNGLPKLINFKSPNYLNEKAWLSINILRLEWYILDSKLNILKKQSYLIANENIHNTVNFEVNNKIKDSYRNQHGRTINNVIKFFNQDIEDYNISVISTFGSDVNYNLLLSEYSRNYLKLDVFKNKVILNIKQFLWKSNIKERLEDMKEIGNAKTRIDMYLNLLKYRISNKKDISCSADVGMQHSKNKNVKHK